MRKLTKRALGDTLNDNMRQQQSGHFSQNSIRYNVSTTQSKARYNTSHRLLVAPLAKP